MSSEESSLQALDRLVNEFFDGETTNSRKKAIEDVLNNFSLQSSAWSQCVYFLNNSKNIYVHMYCLTVFENLVNQKWFGLAGDDKREIKKFLSSYLLQHHGTAPSFVKNKIIKSIVDIGRISWPHFYNDFMSNIFELIKNPSTTIVGVTMLRVTSEEFISPREDLNVARRHQLRTLLLNEIPTALGLLTSILDNVLVQFKKTVTTVTPPPSPSFNHSPIASPFHSPRPSPSSSPQRNASSGVVNHELIVPASGQSNSVRDSNNSFRIIDNQSEELGLAVLQCLAQLFGWIPLSNLLTSSLLGKVFHCAEYTCSIAAGAEQSSADIGIHAMACINEVMSKSFVPNEFESFLLKMAQQSFNLLQIITKGCSGNPDDALLSRLDDSYIEKFTEFLMLFVSMHMKRFEPNPHFPMHEFLQLLLKYTFHQQDVDSLYACLDIWNSFLDYLNGRLELATHSKQDRQSILHRYEESLTDLLNKIYDKVRFETNATQLESLDDVEQHEEMDSCRETFFKELFTTAGKISEILQRYSITSAWRHLQSSIQILFNLQNHITDKADGPYLTITAPQECLQLHYRLQDLSTFLRIIGSYSHLLIGETNFSVYFQDALMIVERLCQAAMFGAYYKTYNLHTSEALKHDMAEVHSQSLATLQAFCHWLAQFHFASLRQKDHTEKFNSLVVTVVEAATCLFGKPIPPRLATAAAQLLLSVTTSVRPSFFLALKNVQQLYERLSTGSLHGCHPQKVELVVFRALSNALILPWPLLPDAQQEWEMRSTNHGGFLSALTKDFLAVPQVVADDQRHKFQDCIKTTCVLLSDIIQTVSSEARRPKAIMHQSTQACIEKSLQLFSSYVQQSDVAEEIVGLLLVSVQSLKVQLGALFVEHVIHQLVELLSRDRLTHIVNNDNDSGRKLIERSLKVLEFVVQEPDPSFKKLLPSILTFVLDHVVPVLSKAHSAPDLTVSVLDLLNQLLVNNWRYFFKSSVIDKLSGDNRVENEHIFASILKTFGMSFLQHDIASFKRSLEIVESLNAKFKLYHLGIFQGSALYTYLEVLLKVLLHKSHALLQDEITVAVYNMAIVDIQLFFSQFLVHFLVGVEGLDDQQKGELVENVKAEKDLPSFTASINQFIGDVRYMQLINNSLRAGSVQF